MIDMNLMVTLAWMMLTLAWMMLISCRFVTCQNTKQRNSLSQLADLCPYADICDRQGKELPSKSDASCCLPCSCDVTCKKIGNCCDKLENDGFMCHSPTLRPSETSENVEYGYFMVDQCLNDNNVDCKGQSSAAWGSLDPVYNQALGLNFYNPTCAECNGAMEYTNWHLNVICKGLITVNDRFFLNVLNGREANCYIEFTPPKQMIEMNHICSDTLISRCNATGRWNTYNRKLEKACSRWFAPVIHSRRGFLQYANIYCKQCNEVFVPNEQDDVCTPPGFQKTPGGVFNMLIDYRKVSALMDERFDGTGKPSEDGRCGKGMAKHISKDECRVISCPNGFIRSGEKCAPLLLETLNDGYDVQLILDPTSDKLLPRSYLEGLTTEQKNNPTSWLETYGAPLDHFQMMVKPVTIDNTAHIGSIIVKLGRKRTPVNISDEIKSLQAALDKQPWVITLHDSVFGFNVRFYRHALFSPLVHMPKMNVLYRLTRVESDIRYIDKDEAYDLIFVKVSDILSSRLLPFTLKKTNFCNRVRLSRSEWIAGFEEIQLNTSKAVFDNYKMLGDSEFDLFLDAQGEPTVEICVDDFNPEYQLQMVTGMAAGLFSSWWLVYFHITCNIICLF